MKSFAASVFLMIASAAHAGENPIGPTQPQLDLRVLDHPVRAFG
nr:hypothetical protein [uncultured Shinella sp.]